MVILMSSEEKTSKQLEKKLAALQKRVAELEQQEKAQKRAANLLQALNRVSQTMSGATTPDDVFIAVADTFEELGFSCAIFTTDPERENIFVNTYTYDSKAVKAAEKLVDVQIESYPMPIDPVDVFRIPVRQRETCFSNDAAFTLRQLLPRPLKKLNYQVHRLLNVPTFINAPMIVGDEVIGILSVQSNDLGEEDMPSITAFAHQVAAAWHQAQLYQQAQQEIVERARMGIALLAERDRAQQYLDIAGVIMVVLNIKGEIELINRKGCEVLGYADSELIGQNWFDVAIGEQERKVVRHVFDQLMKGEIEPVEYYENPVQTRQGRERMIAWHNALLTDDSGKILGTISSGEDISERKQAEVFLMESEQRYRTLASATFEGIGMAEGGVVIDANPQFSEILGYEPHEMIGVSVLDFVAPEDHELVRKQIMAGGEDPYEHRALRKDGEVIFVEVRPRMMNVQGRMIRVTAVRDITERKKAEEALRQHAAQLELLNHIGGEIAALLDLNSLLERAVQLVQERFGYHHVALFLINKEAHCVEMLTKSGYYRELFPSGHRLELGQGVVGWVAEHNATLLTNNVKDEPRYINLYPSILPTQAELTVPIRIAGEAIGVLDVQSPQGNAFDDSDVMVIESIADQVAVALENARLHETINHRARQLAAINQMGQAVTASLDLAQVLMQVINVVPPLVGAEGVSVLLVDGDELVFAAASGESSDSLIGLRIPSNAGVAGDVLKNRQPLLVGSAVDQEKIYRDIEGVSGYHTQSLLAAPLIFEGNVYGVMEAVHSDHAAFANEDLQVIETAASWAAIAIGNARQHETMKRRLQESQALASISQALNETLELDHVLTLIVDSACNIIPKVEKSVIHLYDEDKQILVPTAVSGSAKKDGLDLFLRPGDGIAGHVMADGRTISVSDSREDPRFVTFKGETRIRSLIVAPIQRGEKRLGTISINSEKPNAFSEDDQHMLTILGVQAALAIESARLFDELRQRARHLELINEITRAALQQPDLSTVLQLLADRLGEMFAADACYIAFWDETRRNVIPQAAYGPLREQYPSMSPGPGPGKVTLTSAVLESGQAIAITDVQESPYLNQEITERFAYRAALGIPLVSGGEKIGAVVLTYDQSKEFPAEDIALAESVAQQIALAISKATLLEAEQRRRREAETLREVSTALTATLEIDQVLERVLLHFERAIPCDSASVFLVEQDVLRGVATHGLIDPEMIVGHTFPIDTPTYQEIKATKTTLIIDDVLDDPRWQNRGMVAYIRGWMGVPLIIQGEVFGYLTADSHKPGAYREEHAALAQAFANQAALAIQNANLFAATRRRLEESNTLYYITNQIAASIELKVDDILQQVVDRLWVDYGYYHVHIYLFDSESSALIAHQGSGAIGTDLKQQGYQLTSDQGIVGYVATVGEAFMSNDVDEVHFFMANPLLPNTSAELAVPLRMGERILGVLDILHQKPDFFDDDDIRFVTAVADQLAVVLDKAVLYSQLQSALKKEQSTRAQLVQSEKLAAMGRLIASVAHELNNPLQAIQNALYLVKMEDDLSSQAHEDLDVALNETARMADLISRLRETYRPTNDADFQSVSLNILVTEVHRLLETHLRHSEIECIFTLDPNLPAVAMIRDQVKQVILNLGINAIETMPIGGYLSITTRQEPENNFVQLIISDTGAGIPEEVLPNIFDPFFTTKEGGTGLGLAVSYEIIQNHNGTIEVQSQLGGGSTFTVSLPLQRS
jgi:PAS domain S-box-containing protein